MDHRQTAEELAEKLHCTLRQRRGQISNTGARGLQKLVGFWPLALQIHCWALVSSCVLWACIPPAPEIKTPSWYCPLLLPVDGFTPGATWLSNDAEAVSPCLLDSALINLGVTWMCPTGDLKLQLGQCLFCLRAAERHTGQPHCQEAQAMGQLRKIPNPEGMWC